LEELDEEDDTQAGGGENQAGQRFGRTQQEDVENFIDNFDDLGGFADLFHFIPPIEEDFIEIGEAGPGPSTRERSSRFRQHRFLDDDNDSQYIQEHPTAGHKIRMDKSLHEKWKAAFSTDADGDVDMDFDHNTSAASANAFTPFASELDWQVAQWAVKDQIGHNSLNRLLSIPGVRFGILDLRKH
jgi:hypothetical protein